MFDILAANTFDCANVVVPPATEEAMRFYKSGNILWIIGTLWGFIVPLLFLVKGFTGKLGHFSKKCGKNWFFTIVVYLILSILIFQVLNFPLDFYAGYIRLHDYGLSIQPLGKWFYHYGIGVAITLIFAIAFVWIFYLLLKKSPRRWWFYGSLVSIGILFFVVFIQPVWIDPLYSKFGPMKNKELEQRILSLASKAGIEHGRVFEVNKNQDTKLLNAYVAGFGSTNRIVLWDTLIDKMTPDEVLFVMGHEMGHYVLHHIWWDLLYMGVISFIIFYLTYKVGNFIVKRHHKYLGFKDISDIASLPLLFFLFSFFNFLSTPLSNYVSRTMEHEADRFGLEITRNNQAAGEAFIVLQEANLVNPYPGALYKFWRCTHPPLGERVDFSNHYCPWRENHPLKYSEYFKK